MHVRQGDACRHTFAKVFLNSFTYQIYQGTDFPEFWSGNAAMEVPLTAFMLACAGAAMITVSIVDLFMHIAEEIGLNHTLLMSITGALAVVITKKL